MPWDFVLILAVLGVLVPWRGAVRVRELLAARALSTMDRLTIYASTIAMQWALAAVVAWRCFAHGISLGDVGIAAPYPGLTLAVAAALTLLLAAQQLFSLRALSRVPCAEQGFVGEMARKLLPQDSVEALAFVGLVITVALCEEFLYRGFVFTAFYRAFGDAPGVAIAGSALLFAAAHAYQGRRGIIVTFVVGLVFAGVRLWTGSLVAPMIAHLVTDLIAGLLAPRMLRSARADVESSGVTDN